MLDELKFDGTYLMQFHLDESDMSKAAIKAIIPFLEPEGQWRMVERIKEIEYNIKHEVT